MNVKNILVIRRDNIGDLVCTTPLFESIKTLYPDANVYAYVNTVNAPVLKGNPHVKELFIYKKAKHRDEGESVLSIYWQRFKTILKLRSLNIDTVILANPLPCKHSLKIAKKLGAKMIIGAEIEGDTTITHPFKPEDFDGKHQVEHIQSYLKALTVQKVSTPPVKVYPSSQLQGLELFGKEVEVVGIHISVRRPKSRWDIENYAQLIRHICEQEGSEKRVLLFWSPQRADDHLDEGDQSRAEKLKILCADSPVEMYPTQSLEELISAFSLCDKVICSDGGPMHLAAALDKPLLVFFGETSVEHWHPWSQNYQILQSEDGLSNSIPCQLAFRKFQLL